MPKACNVLVLSVAIRAELYLSVAIWQLMIETRLQARLTNEEERITMAFLIVPPLNQLHLLPTFCGILILNSRKRGGGGRVFSVGCVPLNFFELRYREIFGKIQYLCRGTRKFIIAVIRKEKLLQKR